MSAVSQFEDLTLRQWCVEQVLGGRPMEPESNDRVIEQARVLYAFVAAADKWGDYRVGLTP